MKLHILIATAILVGLVIVVLAGSSSGPTHRPASGALPGYDMDRPTASFALPPTLREISALTDIDLHHVACLHDEAGAVFHIDLRTGEVGRAMVFGQPGDFEGLTRVADDLWALRSDGMLVHLQRSDDELVVRRNLQLRTNHRDIEGLAYDPFRKLILVSPKDPPAGKKDERQQRRILAIDPATGRQLDEPALSTSLDQIAASARQRGIQLPGTERADGPPRVTLKLRLSSIAVHPHTGQFYLLSAVDGAVLVVDQAGDLQAAYFFDSRLMPKVEGITFLPDGDMVIASEGVSTPPRLQVFDFDRRGVATGR